MGLEANLSTARISSLDAARALAAVFGILLHTACRYMKYPIPEWPRFAAEGSIFFNYLACLIHLFRLPVFFFLAGYFAYFLLKKLKFGGFAQNRFKRIVIPWLIFALAYHFPSLLDKLLKHQIHSIDDIYRLFYNLSYLWFLEYLVIYYFCLLAVVPLFGKVKSWLPSDQVIAQWILSSEGGWLLITVNIGLLYALKSAWYTPVLLCLVPNAILVALYGIYFFLGVLLARFNLLHSFFKLTWQIPCIGLLAYLGYCYLMFNPLPIGANRLITLTVYMVASYSLFLSFIGGCLKFLSKQNKLFRFMADASYWIYLSQLIFILLVYPLTAQWFVSITVQFTVTCLFVLGLTLISYRLFTIARYNQVQRKSMEMTPSRLA